MSKSQKQLYIGLISFLSIFIFLIFCLFFKYKTNEINFSVPINHTIQNASIMAGESTINLQFSSGTSLFDALNDAKNAGNIEFSGKNYPGLGFFVTNIGTLHGGNGKHLIYYVNGNEATVGVSSYTLNDNDIVEWKLE